MPISGNIVVGSAAPSTIITAIPDYYGVTRKSGLNTLKIEGSLSGAALAFRAIEYEPNDGTPMYITVVDTTNVSMNYTVIPIEKQFRCRGAGFMISLGIGGICNVVWTIF